MNFRKCEFFQAYPVDGPSSTKWKCLKNYYNSKLASTENTIPLMPQFRTNTKQVPIGSAIAQKPMRTIATLTYRDLIFRSTWKPSAYEKNKTSFVWKITQYQILKYCLIIWSQYQAICHVRFAKSQRNRPQILWIRHINLGKESQLWNKNLVLTTTFNRPWHTVPI